MLPRPKRVLQLNSGIAETLGTGLQTLRAKLGGA